MLLKKDVSAIHCFNYFTLLERKLFNALLFNAYPDLPYKQRFEIKGKELYQLIGYNSKDTAKLKEAIRGLITLAIEWDVIDCADTQEKKWKVSSILASAELTGGMCYYEYSQTMKELLYQPKVYGQVDLQLVSQFKSSYGLALYENCIRYKGLAQTPWFPIEVFRKLMGVFEDKYILFKDFKKRVIDIGIKEVNALSPIKISPEIERSNQKVINIRFRLNKDTKATFHIPVMDSSEEELTQLLIQVFGLSQTLVQDTYSKYELDYIRQKIEVITQSDSFTTGKIRGLAGYLIEALKKDFRQSRSSQSAVVAHQRIIQIVEKEKKEEEDKEIKLYQTYVDNKIQTFLVNLSPEQHTALMLEFDSFIHQQTHFLKMWYTKHGLDHPATKSSFNHFIIETKRSGVGPVLSKAEYLSSIKQDATFAGIKS